MRKIFQSSYGLEGHHLKLRDVCMDLEPCFKVHNLVIIHLKNTKLGQMTNFKVVFHMMVLFFINLMKLATRPSSLLNLKVANYELTKALQDVKTNWRKNRKFCNNYRLSVATRTANHARRGKGQ